MSRLTTTASLSLRSTTHSSGSLALALISWWGTNGGTETETPRTGLGGEFQPLAPTHARHAAHHVDDALELAVVMCPGLGVGTNIHGACPNLLGAHAGIVDRSLAIHARRLWGVGIECMRRN